MNILPLIFAFLLIFSFFAFNFLKEGKSSFLAESVLDSYNRVESNLQNRAARKTYTKLKGETIQSKTINASRNQQTNNLVSYRTLFPLLETSKFNLAPLIKDGGEFKLHPLYQPLANLLHILYGENLCKTEDMEYRVLDALLPNARKNPDMESLAELVLDDPLIQKIYYKMLKGTNQYQVGKEGIPPLEDFITVRKENSAIFFSFASPGVLEALLGEEITSRILLEEEKKRKETNKYYYFSKEELQALVMNSPAQFSNFSSLDSYIDYSKQFKSRKERGGKDEKTGLSLKK